MRLRSICVACLVVSFFCAPLGAQTGSLVGKVVAQRTTDGDHAVLVSVPSSIDGASVSTVRVAVGRKVARQASAQTLPVGWTMVVDKGWLVFSGPPLAAGSSIALAAGVDRPLDPEDVVVEIQGEGLTLAEGSVPLETWAAIGPPLDPNEVVVFPPVASVGGPVTFRLEDPELELPPGHWMVGDTVAEEREPGIFKVTLGYPVQLGLDIPISYTDLWGQTLVDGVLAGVQLVPDAALDEPPRITACSPKVLTGGILCVCGYFPTVASREYLTINGQQLGKPITSSQWILTFKLPKVPPGEFTVVGPTEVGFTAGSTATGIHIAVRGEIDRNRLMRGESTPLTMWIDGTDEPMSLRLWNTTPQIVSLEGGEDQVVTTSGGSSNQMQRTVHAVSPGDFTINYELTGYWCPCAETIAEEAVTTLIGPAGVAEIVDGGLSDACAKAAADCEKLRLLAQAAAGAASAARAESYWLEADRRWTDDEADWIFETSERTRIYMAALQKQVKEWRELAEQGRAQAKKNWERDATYPGTGWDHWARRAEEDAERRDAHADQLEQEIEQLRGDTANQEERVRKLDEAIEQAKAEVAKAQAEADKAWAAYKACLAAVPTECPAPITGSLLYAGPVTIVDDDGEPRDVDPFDPEAKICGPDVTEHVLDVLEKMIRDFDNVRPASKKGDACANIVVPWLDENLEFIPDYAFDVYALSPNVAPPKEGPQAGKLYWFENVSEICARPRPYPCGPTVEFLGECIHSQVVNYIMWGLMNELCDQRTRGELLHRARAEVSLQMTHYRTQEKLSTLGAAYVRSNRRHDADLDFRQNPTFWTQEKLREMKKELLSQLLEEMIEGDEAWQAREAQQCATVCRLTPEQAKTLSQAGWRYTWYGINRTVGGRIEDKVTP